MKNIGIVCEGPTDYIVLKRVIDKITGEDNKYYLLQPEPDLTGAYGNGWKGIWKWCMDNGPIKVKLMKDIQPALDVLVIQMDGDVSRKEKPVHCGCSLISCEFKGTHNPLECNGNKEIREQCPIILPCTEHEKSVKGYMEHLEGLIKSWLQNIDDTCIVIPCDSTEAWIVAAYDELQDAELVEDPWMNLISKRKTYHDIRIAGHKKRVQIYEQFAEVVCEKWNRVTELCLSAKHFEENVTLFGKRTL